MDVLLDQEVVVEVLLHSMLFSIIIPTLNEEHALRYNTLFFKKMGQELDAEIILVDGGSNDTTTKIAKDFTSNIVISSPSRSKQQNLGAKYAAGDFLIFIHADTIVDDEAIKCIKKFKKDCLWGFFKLSFNSDQLKFKILAYLINLRSRIFDYATGDQVIIIEKDFFIENRGFKNICLMEDIEFTNRVNKIKKPTLLNGYASTSPRRWEKKGFFKTIITMRILRLLYHLGVSDKLLSNFYK